MPIRGIGVREKILAMPPVGVGGKTHVCRYKCADWESMEKSFTSAIQPHELEHREPSSQGEHLGNTPIKLSSLHKILH